MLIGRVLSTPHMGLPFTTMLVVAGSLAYPAEAADTAESPEPVGAATAAGESDGPIVLPALVVSGSRYRTETTEGYTTDLISVGEKEARSPREVPQSTTVLTRDYLEDRGARSMDTALREAPGIVVLNNDNGRSSILARGFEFDSLYLNGLPAPELSIYGTQPDMAIVDHIEILKGPAGLFGGAGEPAGAINMSLKQPARTFQGYATLTGDTWAGFRAEGDVSAPFNESGTLRSRLVLAHDEQESWIEDSENTTRLAYGTAQTDLTEQTTASITVSLTERDILPNNGLPTFADGDLVDVDRSTTTAADWNTFNNSITDYIAELEHRFDGGGHVRASARYADRWVDFLYAYAGGPADETGEVSSMRWLARELDQTSLAVDAHLSKPVTLLGQEHNILIGADYQRVVDTLYSEIGTIATTNNIYNWNTDVPKPDVTYTSRTETTVNQYGVYGQARIKPVSALTLIGGGRMTWYDSEVVDLNTFDTVATLDLNEEFTPYAGAVLDITPKLSAYASYTAIFQPQSQVDVNDQPLDPRQGEQYELGLKSGFFDDTLNVSGALFMIRDKNRALQNEGGEYEAREEVEARGIEVEASGEVLPGWDVLAGYTYTETEYVNGMNEGATFSAVTPEHMAHVWATYQFAEDGMLDGLTVGGGVKAFSDFSSVNRGVEIKAERYAVVDLMARYDLTENFSTTLSINNAFDTKYYERVGGTSVFNFYGQPLSAMLSAKAVF